jgi:putative ABC transport system permease protein
MDVFIGDVRLALRSLGRTPGLCAVVVLTLGLGVGVVTALFAVVDAVLLHPIVPDQERVVRVWKRDVERGSFRHSVTYHEFAAWRDEARSFESLAAILYADASPSAIVVDGNPVPAAVTPVAADFSRVLAGGTPLQGRWLREDDELPGTELAVVVSERFWRRAMSGDREVVGARLAWAGDPRLLLVVGVAPEGFEYPLGTDIWVPIARLFDGTGERFDVRSRRLSHFEVLGRLTPVASIDQARAELQLLHDRIAARFPDDYRPMQVVIAPLLDTVLGSSREVLLFLFAAAAIVFVIAGVNVAALLLMRASSQRRELAVRVALGASPVRLASQTVTHSAVLATFAALCGIVVAQTLLRSLQWLAPGDVPRIEHAALNPSVLGFSAAIVLVWVVVFGSAPIWSVRRLESALGRAADAVRGAPGTRGLRLFTVGEVAAAVVVAIAAGLLVRSFVRLQGIERGFNSSNLAVVRLLLPNARYPDAATRRAFYDRILWRAGLLPGVVAASPIHLEPGTAGVGLSAPMIFDGQAPKEAATNPWASWEPVMPSYFKTLGIPIVRGRGFSDGDRADTAPVAIVSEAVARRYWPGQDAVGKRVRFVSSSSFPWATVVGVAGDLRYRELTRNWLTVYFPAEQFFFFSPDLLVVRTAAAPEALAPALRETIREQDPQVAIETISTMDTLLARELARPRAAVMVTMLFAFMAIVLSAVGVYAVMSYDVRRRRQELAIRSALGASPRRIFRAVVLRSLGLGAAGASIGLAAASVLTRSLRALLFEVDALDAGAFMTGAAVLVAVVLLASCPSARRAAAADPIRALRAE